jgi:hypothetical protein
MMFSSNDVRLEVTKYSKRMETILILAVIVVAVYGFAKIASGDRYAKMTGEEFEAEAKRSSHIGGAMLEVQKMVDPGHRVEYMQRREKHAEADTAESGGPPESGSSPSEKSKSSS